MAARRGRRGHRTGLGSDARVRRRTPRPPERRRQRQPHQLVDRRRLDRRRDPRRRDRRRPRRQGEGSPLHRPPRRRQDLRPEFLAAHATPKGGHGTATAGDTALRRPGTGTATAGDSGTATAGTTARTAGYSGTATAGSPGLRDGDYGTATAGTTALRRPGTTALRRPGTTALRRPGSPALRRPGTTALRRRYDGTATAGDYGTATAGDDAPGSPALRTAGERGTIIIAWWDSELGRRRWVVGEVGIDGIVADTPYRVVDGALAEVESPTLGDRHHRRGAHPRRHLAIAPFCSLTSDPQPRRHPSNWKPADRDGAS